MERASEAAKMNSAAKQLCPKPTARSFCSVMVSKLQKVARQATRHSKWRDTVVVVVVCVVGGEVTFFCVSLSFTLRLLLYLKDEMALWSFSSLMGWCEWAGWEAQPVWQHGVTQTGVFLSQDYSTHLRSWQNPGGPELSNIKNKRPTPSPHPEVTTCN